MKPSRKTPARSPRPRCKPRLAELLLDVSNSIAVAGTLGESLDALVNLTVSAIGAERGSIFLNDPRTRELYTRVAAGKSSREVRMLNHLGIAGYVFTRGQGIIIPDAYKDERFNPDVDSKTGYSRETSFVCRYPRSRATSSV